MSSLWTLFITFFKIGAFTFGGGYAMIPLIQDAVINEHQWVTREEFIDMLAVVEMTPGPVAINSATFLGYKVAGVTGSVFATLGVVLPSVIVITVIAKFFGKFSDNKYVKWAFQGIRPVALGLILSAVFSIGYATIGNIVSFALFLGFFGLLLTFKLHPIVLILIAAVTGIVLY